MVSAHLSLCTFHAQAHRAGARGGVWWRSFGTHERIVLTNPHLTQFMTYTSPSLSKPRQPSLSARATSSQTLCSHASRSVLPSPPFPSPLLNARSDALPPVHNRRATPHACQRLQRRAAREVIHDVQSAEGPGDCIRVSHRVWRGKEYGVRNDL